MPTWYHEEWASSLASKSGVTLGEVYRSLKRWGATSMIGDGNRGLYELGTYLDKDSAIKAVEDYLNPSYRER